MVKEICKILSSENIDDINLGVAIFEEQEFDIRSKIKHYLLENGWSLSHDWDVINGNIRLVVYKSIVDNNYKVWKFELI